MSVMEKHYTEFWNQRMGVHFYPPEFLVRTFLSHNCPNLKINRDYVGKRVLDLGCGDGRSMGLFANLQMEICGTEITDEICGNVTHRMQNFGIKADIRTGRNNSIPFPDAYFDYLVGSASVYYVDEGDTFERNMAEVRRVLKPGGYVIFSLVHPDTYILAGAKPLPDFHAEIVNDPLGIRNGYKFKVFQSKEHIVEYFSQWFEDISTGYTMDDYYGLVQNLWLVVAKKKVNA